MLLRLEMALSPPGLGQFLATRAEPYLRKRASERFRAEGDDVVGEWLPLTRYTQDVRASQGYGAAHPINRRTGRLEDYITHSPASITMHSSGASLKYPGTKPTGELKDKVRTAQMGKPYPKTPPRPVLGMNHRDLEAVLLGLAMHIKEF